MWNRIQSHRILKTIPDIEFCYVDSSHILRSRYQMLLNSRCHLTASLHGGHVLERRRRRDVPRMTRRPATTVASKSVVPRRGLPSFSPSLKIQRRSEHAHRPILCNSAASSTSIVPKKDPGIQWGADLKTLAICVGAGVAIWFCPSPEGVSTEAWHLLSIFVGTIMGIVTTPLPLGAVAIIGLGVATLTKTLTFSAAFSALATEIPYHLCTATTRCDTIC